MVLGTLIAGILTYLFDGLIAGLIVLFIWLALVKHFFDTEWLKVFVISIVALLIWIVIAVIIGIIVGIAIIGGGLIILL